MIITETLADLLPKGSPRSQPFDSLYTADERPPAPVLLALTAQHLVGVIPSVVFVLMMAKLCGLTNDVTHTLVSGTLIAMGASTFFQA